MHLLTIRRLSPLLLVAIATTILTFSSDAQKLPSATPFVKAGAMFDRAQFEVTLFRVHVTNQSLENAVEFAGAGDEVSFSRVAILHNARTGSSFLSTGLNLSPTYGEQPPNAIRAGNASPRGGFKTRDDFTLPIPEMLFREELIQGESAATIIVNAWEMDGETSLYRHYESFLTNYEPDFERIALGTLRNSPRETTLVRDFDNSFTGGASGPRASVVTLGDGPLGLGDPKDRPIGMIRDGNRYNFVPKIMILNFENASCAAATDMGYGTGVVKINFQDDQKLKGDYTLFVRIRRL